MPPRWMSLLTATRATTAATDLEAFDDHRHHASQTSAAMEDRCTGRANSSRGLRRTAKSPVFQRQRRREIFLDPESSDVRALTDVVAPHAGPMPKSRHFPVKTGCFTGLVTGSRTW